MIEGLPPPDKKPKKLESHVDTLSFADRQKFMQEMLAVQENLKKQLGRRENGFETIDGKKIYVEEATDGYMIRGLEWLTNNESSPAMVINPGKGSIVYPDRETAVTEIEKVAQREGFTIVE